MNLEDNLRDRLESASTPPSRVDVEMLVIAGRRRAFRRRAAETAGGVALVTAVLLAVPWVLNTANKDPVAPLVAGAGKSESPTPAVSGTPLAPAAPASAPTTPLSRSGDCVMEKLAVPEGTGDVSAAAVDPTGRFIVGNGSVGQDFRGVLWSDGKPHALPLAGESVQATDVNSSGVVVGLVSEGAESYAFRYQDGRLTRLRTPKGDWHVYPEPAINASGDIVLNAEPRGNTGGRDSIVLLWKAGGTTATRLPLPAGANASDIGDDGTLVGAMYVDGSAVDAYSWDQKGEGRKLERPDGAEGAAAYAVSGEWATGGVWTGGNGRAAVWSLRTGALAYPKLTEVGAAVNSAGLAVGLDGAVARGGAALALDAPKGEVAIARDVSDTGLVVGLAMSDDKQDTANLGPRAWRC